MRPEERIHFVEGSDEILEIVNLGHPTLREVSVPVPSSELGTPSLRRYAQQLIDTMLDADGVGLASPQVAMPWRCFAYFVPGPGDTMEVEPRVLFNPELRPLSLDRALGWEGCLSLPYLRGIVPRFEGVEVNALDVDGNSLTFQAKDFEARVIQHEYDHLEGVIFLDRMDNMDSLCYEDEWERYVLGVYDDDNDEENDDT